MGRSNSDSDSPSTISRLSENAVPLEVGCNLRNMSLIDAYIGIL